MATERQERQSELLAHLKTKNKRELFRDVIEADGRGDQLSLPNYLGAYLHSCGITVKSEFQETPATDKQLVIALNHHSRSNYFTTEESLRAVGIATTSAIDSGLTQKHIAWIIRELKISPIGIGKQARQVQNATIGVFGTIPARIEKKLTRKGVLPVLRDRLTNIAQMVEKIAYNVNAQNAIGLFPEQEPTWELRPFHRNYPRVLDGLKFLVDEVQIATLAISYEGNVANARWGPIILVDKNTDTIEAANNTMKGIASGMPSHLRGHYS